MFLTLMLVGIIGLILMALPGFQRHGHMGGTTHIAPHAHAGIHLAHGPGAHAAGHALPGAHAGHAMPHTGTTTVSHAAGTQGPAASVGQNAEAPAGFELTRLIPSPRAIFSMLTL